MATALVDLYNGEEFERFDRLILPEGYRPSDGEEFMCAKHRAYFLRKLKECRWNIARTAKAIDTPRSNLYKKLEQYGISRDQVQE